MKLSAFFSEKQNEVCHKGEQNNQNKDIEFQSSSAQEEGSQYQSGDCQSEASMDNLELSKDSLSSGEQKASALEERASGGFAVDEGEYDYETACSESCNDADGDLGVPQSPDAKSRCSNLCSTSSTGSHLSLPLQKSAAKPSGRPHSTLTDPNFVENYFKVFSWNK